MAASRSPRSPRNRRVASASFEIGPGHKDAQKKQKLYNKGKGTDNPNEKDTFLKRTGPQLPLAKRKPKGKGKGGGSRYA